jgi:hypothetical protein
MIFSVGAYATSDNPLFIDEETFNKLVEEGRIPKCVTYEYFIIFITSYDSQGNFFISEEAFNKLVEEGIVPAGVTYDYFIYYMGNSDNIKQYIFGDESEVY